MVFTQFRSQGIHKLDQMADYDHQNSIRIVEASVQRATLQLRCPKRFRLNKIVIYYTIYIYLPHDVLLYFPSRHQPLLIHWS